MRLRRAFGAQVVVPLHRPGLTAQEFTEETGNHPPGVPVDQPAPPDMPLPLEVLASLADDSETIYTMRAGGDFKPHGLQWVGENALLAAVRSLLGEGLIEVESEYVVDGDVFIHREPLGNPGTSDEDLKRYWFVMTRAGWAALEAGAADLDAYEEMRPLELKAQRDR
jgi:hypothetical protein